MSGCRWERRWNGRSRRERFRSRSRRERFRKRRHCCCCLMLGTAFVAGYLFELCKSINVVWCLTAECDLLVIGHSLLRGYWFRVSNKLMLLDRCLHAPPCNAPQVGLIDRLSAAGCGSIEAASFVSPKWVPQMADGSEVLAEIRRPLGVKFAALTPNLQGLERAIDAGVDEVQFPGSHIGVSLSLSRALVRLNFKYRPLISEQSGV